jgi:hypothetical protein
MKKFSLITSLLAAVALISASFNTKPTYRFHHSSRSAGAAAIFDAGYTGAGFDNFGNTCDNCHGGGSFSPSLTVELLNGSGNPVTTYSTGQTYTLRLTIAAQTGTPGGYGFQTMAARQSNDANVNAWGTAPTNTHNTLTSGGRNYIEHSTQLPSGVINIPWIGPAATTGAVTFYSIGNVIDYDFSSGGDEPTISNSLTVTYASPPCTTNTWTGTVNNTWETAGNWSCGVVPDATMDVIINSGTVTLNSNRSCRSIRVNPTATFTVNAPFVLTVVH